MTNDTILIGADPEVFFVDKTTGHFKFVTGMLGGTKKKPKKIDDQIAVQEDGAAAEYNISPASTRVQFLNRINRGLRYLRTVAEANDCELSFSPVAEFEEQYFYDLATEHPEAIVLGCQPDFDRNGKIKVSKLNQFMPLRTSSGHIHVGWHNKEPQKGSAYKRGDGFAERVQFVTAIGPELESLGVIWENDLSAERRKYYGGDYAWRPKPYGVELRQLDGLWLQNLDYQKIVYDFVHNFSVDYFKSKGYNFATKAA
jgi:hypothetical protein